MRFAGPGRSLRHGPAVRATGDVAHLVFQHRHRQVGDLGAAGRALVGLALVHGALGRVPWRAFPAAKKPRRLRAHQSKGLRLWF